MRAAAAIAFLILLATFAPPSLFREPAIPKRSLVRFKPVPLNPDDPAQRRVGRLVFLQGWELTSNDPRFGGISSIHVEGREVTALSDSGALIRFALRERGIGPLDIRMLHDGPGSPSSKFDRDTEAMAVHGGQAWVVFERRNVIWRYATADWRGRSATKPDGMDDWSANSGGEAIARLPDGRFLVFSESYRRKDGATDALLFARDPIAARGKAVKLGYRAPEGYQITDAAALRDGSILFLNRRFRMREGFAAKLTLAVRPRLMERGVVLGEEIAHLVAPLASDNLEALSVTREDGRPILWLASDDNYMSLQRTLLLKFRLEI